jgi:PDZ domain-containing protein/carboxypeptidase family protein
MRRPLYAVVVLLIFAIVIALSRTALRRHARAPGATTNVTPPTATRERPRPAPPLQLSSATAQADATSADGSFGGRVLSTEDQKPIARAALTFLHEGAALSTETDALGRFLVRASSPGAYELTAATAAGFTPFEPQLGHSPVTLWARAGVRLEDVTIYLSPERELVVVVEDAAHKPIAGAEVRAFDPDRGPGDVKVAHSDAKGEAKVAAQEFEIVEARKAGYASARAWVQRAALRTRRLRLQLAPGADRPRSAICGHVVDRAGRPVDGALVEAFGHPGLDGDGPAGAQTLSGADGRFTLAPLDDGSYTVRATTRDAGGVMVPNVAAGTRDLELRLGPATAALRGTVSDGSGKPVTAFTVVAWPLEGVLGRGPEERATVIDAQGRYVLPLPPGRYAVAAVAHGFARSPDRTVDLGDDGVTLDFTLRGGSRIFGRVVERDGGAPIAGADVLFEGAAIDDGVTMTSNTKSAADGSFTIDGAPAGRQSLNVQASGHNSRVLGALIVPSEGALGPLTIDLGKTAPGEEPSTEFVGIGAALGAGARGMVVNSVLPGGGAAEAGLVAGDIILTIDGQDVAQLGFVDAIQLIRGPEDSIVTLSVKHQDGSVQLVPVRRKRVSF